MEGDKGSAVNEYMRRWRDWCRLEKTLSEIASEYGIHPEQARRWINQFIASAHLEKYYHLRYQIG